MISNRLPINNASLIRIRYMLKSYWSFLSLILSFYWFIMKSEVVDLFVNRKYNCIIECGRDLFPLFSSLSFLALGIINHDFHESIVEGPILAENKTSNRYEL